MKIKTNQTKHLGMIFDTDVFLLSCQGAGLHALLFFNITGMWSFRPRCLWEEERPQNAEQLYCC